MSMHKRTAAVTIARQTRSYIAGDRVRILRGTLRNVILTIREAQNDWVSFNELYSREIMSKGNVEPEQGFTEDELNQARRISEKIWKAGII